MMRFCIILGAMKAGTTSLFNYLAQHPEIAPCSEKEPSFFTHHYNKGVNWFLSLWKGQDLENKILLTASTNNTKYPSFPNASQNIFDFSKKNDVALKFIYVMRNPIKRIESQHTYVFARWTKQPLGERLDPNSHLINVSRYALQLDQYTEKFDLRDLLLLDFDDLTHRTPQVLAAICEFLEIDSSYPFADLNTIHNPSKGTRIARPVEMAYRKYPRLKRLAKLIPQRIRNAILYLFFRQTIEKKLKLTEDQKQKVHDALKDDMARLRDKYGVDVSKWGF